jgi:glycosyltransferase involved in cell wall biosynthesis
MTLLVNNEADILEKHIRFHKAMGVDAFIVTDNNSTDGTIDILEKYAAKGWIK